MTDLRQAAQQALEALEDSFDTVRNEYETDWRHGLPTRKAQLDGMKEMVDNHEKAITTLRTALEQQAEPVAWQVMVEDEAMKEFPIKDMAYDWCIQQKLSGSSYVYWMRPLYTTPPKRQWQGLTDENMKDPKTHILDFIYGARWAEAKLKERNND